MTTTSNKTSAATSTNQNTSITIDVLKNDTPSGAPKILKSLSGTHSAKGALISIVNGKVVYNPDGDPTLAALAAGETTTDTFTYTMSEAGNKTFTATVTVTVTGLNDPPVISGNRV
jgi:VCBS repeat-containing protein